MAVTIAKVNNPTSSHVDGDRLEVFADITLDNSYPTGGYPLAASALGLVTSLDFVDVAPEAAGGRYFAYDYVNSKLKVFAAGGAEVANTTDLHLVVGRLHAVGKGFATIIN